MVAQFQQRLVGMRRDGGNVLGSVCQGLLYDDTTIASADTVLAQVDFLPKVAAQLQDSPDEVVKIFEEIRDSCECTLFLLLCRMRG